MSRLQCALFGAAAAVCWLGTAGCGDAGSVQRLEIFAASSLTEVFGELAPGFSSTPPGAAVALSFAGSQVLRLQIEQGAPADVFASASAEHMQALLASGHVRDAVDFASNDLVIIVPAGDPTAIADFADLGQARRLVIGSPTVPVGHYTRRMFERARRQYGDDFVDAVVAAVVSEESNARLVRAKVQLGEADAAIVYRTDAAAGSGLRVVEIPEPVNVRATYSVAVVDGSASAALAERWISSLTSALGRQVLERHGFGAAR